MINLNFSKIKIKKITAVLASVLLLVVILSILTLVFLNKNKILVAQISDDYIRVCVDPDVLDLSDVTRPIFKWDTFGNSQINSFQFQVADNQDFILPKINIEGSPEDFDDLGVIPIITEDVESHQYQYQAPSLALPLAKTYWYRVNVSDDGARWTGWTGCYEFYLRGLDPLISDLKYEFVDKCQIELPVIFFWTFTDEETDFQTAYQVQVDNNSDFSSPEIDSCVPGPGTCGEGRESGSYATFLGKDSYNQTYYWQVRAWDREGNSSGWVSGSPIDDIPLHIYPQPDFSFFPEKPGPNQDVDFTDESNCYDSNNIKYDCQDDMNRYQWDFENDEEIDCDSNINSDCRGDVTTTYSEQGDLIAKLIITDSIGTCSKIKPISIKFLLPKWREIAPF